MGAFGSGFSNAVDSSNQLKQQTAHNDFMRSLMQSMGSQGGSPLAPTMTGPTQGPQLPAGGGGLRSQMMGQLNPASLLSLLKLGAL